MKINYYKVHNSNVQIGYDSDISELTAKLQDLNIFKKEQTREKNSCFPTVLKIYGKEMKINEVIEAIGILQIAKPPAY